MNVYDNIQYCDYVEMLKRWYKSLEHKCTTTRERETDKITGCMEGYIDCLDNMGLLKGQDKADILEATIDYITGAKDTLSPYED